MVLVVMPTKRTSSPPGGTDPDQVGNPWALDRTAGGSSGGPAAALRIRRAVAARWNGSPSGHSGSDTAGSLLPLPYARRAGGRVLDA